MEKLATQAPPAVGTPEFDARALQMEAFATVLSLQRLDLPAASPPPIHAVADLKRLANDEALLVFADVGGNLIAFLYIDGKVHAWNVAATKIVQADVAKVLKELGVSISRGASRFMGEDKWPDLAVTLRRRLIPDEHSALLDDVSKLIVFLRGRSGICLSNCYPRVTPVRQSSVSGFPFSTHRRQDSRSYRLLIQQVTSRSEWCHRCFSRPRDGDKNSQMVSDVVDSLKSSTPLPPEPLRPMNSIGDTLGGLAVLGVTTPNPAQPLALVPAAYDANDPRGTLKGWMSFPGHVPRSVALFGYARQPPALQSAMDKNYFSR